MVNTELLEMVRDYRASEATLPVKTALKQGDKVMCRGVYPWEDGDVTGTVIDPGDGTEDDTVVVEGPDGVWLELEPGRLELVKS